MKNVLLLSLSVCCAPCLCGMERTMRQAPMGASASSSKPAAAPAHAKPASTPSVPIASLLSSADSSAEKTSAAIAAVVAQTATAVVQTAALATAAVAAFVAEARPKVYDPDDLNSLLEQQPKVAPAMLNALMGWLQDYAVKAQAGTLDLDDPHVTSVILQKIRKVFEAPALDIDPVAYQYAKIIMAYMKKQDYKMDKSLTVLISKKVQERREHAEKELAKRLFEVARETRDAKEMEHLACALGDLPRKPSPIRGYVSPRRFVETMGRHGHFGDATADV